MDSNGSRSTQLSNFPNVEVTKSSVDYFCDVNWNILQLHVQNYCIIMRTVMFQGKLLYAKCKIKYLCVTVTNFVLCYCPLCNAAIMALYTVSIGLALND